MILHDISDDAELVEVAASSFCAERLLECDLNVIDVVAIPVGTQEFITEADDQQILDHLLAQVVVNTEDLLLCQK